MVCTYCSGRTEVINSRLQRNSNAVWRRRRCLTCRAVFTTHEQTDLSTALLVQYKDDSLNPFSRDKLFLSILKSCGHRNAPINDAGALTNTVISRLPTPKKGALESQYLTKITYAVLSRFDEAAATHYRAYHPSPIS